MNRRPQPDCHYEHQFHGRREQQFTGVLRPTFPLKKFVQHAGSNARCSASLAITITGLCSTQRFRTASMTMAHLLGSLDAFITAKCRNLADRMQKNHL
jgi:hypothetical protein